MGGNATNEEESMIRELITDEEILSKPCVKATADDASVAQDLLDTMATIEDAACLAANQIGETKAVIAYLNENDEPSIMYNPSLKQALHPLKTEEMCLTREGLSKVTRFQDVVVIYGELVDGELVPRKKKMQGWTAQIVQHMIDHCKGKLV